MNVIRTVIPVAGGLEFIYTDVITFLKEQAAEAERPQIALAVANGMRGN